MTMRIKILAAAVAYASLQQGTVVFAQEVLLEEVVVTARKRDESLMEIPVSVAVVDQGTIQAANLQSINDLADSTPGLKFNSAFGRQADRPVVRGVSAIQTANELAGFFIDGVYVAGSLQNFDLDSLARVEVIKGPQSATFGRRTFSGAINYVTQPPSEDLTGRIKIELGNNGHQVLSASVSNTADKFGFRANLRSYQYEGDYDNTLNTGAFSAPDIGGEKALSGNLTLAYAFTDNTAISFNANYVKNDDDHYATSLQPSSDNNCSFGVPPRDYYCGTIKNDVPISLGGFRPASDYGLSGDMLRTYIKFDHDFGNVVLRWTSAYNQSEQTSVRDVTAAGLQFVFAFPGPPDFGPGLKPANEWHPTFEEKSSDYSHELWLSGDITEGLAWRAGLYTYSEETDIDTYNADGTISARNGLVTDKVDNNAVMAALDWAPLDQLNLGLELRYAQDKISTEISDGANSTKYKDTFTSLTHRLSASWNFNDTNMIYGTWSQGVLPGEFNTNLALPEDLRTVDEQKLEMFELGYKSDLTSRLSLVTAIYTMEWKDQVRSEFYTGGGAALGYSSNQGSSDIRGLEASINWLALDSLMLTGSFSYNHTEIKDFISTDRIDVAITGDGDMSGNEMPLSPKWDAYGSATHTLNFSNGFDLQTRLDVSYQDSRYVRVANLAETGSSTVWNLGTALTMDSWRVALWIKNLTDEDAVVSTLRYLEADSFFLSGTAFQTTPRRGREFGITASYDF